MERKGDIFTLITTLSSSIPYPPSLHLLFISCFPLESPVATSREKIEEECYPQRSHPLSVEFRQQLTLQPITLQCCSTKSHREAHG